MFKDSGIPFQCQDVSDIHLFGYISVYNYLLYHIEFIHLDVYHFTSRLTRFCLFIYMYVFILVFYNSMDMPVSIIIIFLQRKIFFCFLDLYQGKQVIYITHVGAPH